MSDWVFFPAGAAPARAAERPATSAVQIWLWIVAAMVFAMVVVGGATRLTESGLSITEWKLVNGIIPPLDDASWQAEFANYQRIPQFAQLFPDMDLAHFKFIFFWEWGHRLLGRLLGVVMAVPLLWFWATRQMSNALGVKLTGVLALGGLQGFAGWWMVKSGLTERVEVSQYRLAVHLLLASVTFAALVWLATGLRESPFRRGQEGLRGIAVGLAGLVLAQIGMGALVAGLRAGLTYNTWPLMDGVFVPPLEHLARLSPLWTNFFENITTVQFQHRMTAYAVLALAVLQVALAWRIGGGPLKRSAAIAGLAFCQAGLGIATLLLAVPLWAGLAHQAVALLLLGMAVVHRRALG